MRYAIFKIILNVLLILFLCLMTHCDSDELTGPKGPFEIEVDNYTCTSWTITEDGTVITTINKSYSDDSYTNKSFIAEKGKHTYNFSPEPDTCFFTGWFLGYVYEQVDLEINIECDKKITIGIFLLTVENN